MPFHPLLSTPTSPVPATALEALTGLRFFAATAVFVYHAILFVTGSDHGLWVASSTAVSFFFVLSGFILVHVYHERLWQIGVREFLVTRIARLWPLHLACLLTILASGSHRPLDDGLASVQLLLNAAMMQSWIPVYDWAFSFNNVSWSISTEFGFYLLFPLLLAAGRRRFYLVWLAVAAGTALMFLGTNWLVQRFPAMAPYVSSAQQTVPLFRLLEFTTGMGAGFLMQAGWRLRPARGDIYWHTILEVVAAGLVVVSTVTAPLGNWMVELARQLDWPTATAWLAKGGSTLLFATLLILVFAHSRGLLARLAGSPLLVYLGEISYSLYMVHYLVLLNLARNSAPQVSPVVKLVAAFVISLALSSILYQFVERPGRRLMLSLFRGRGIDAAQRGLSATWNFVVANRLHFTVPAILFAVLVVMADNQRWLLPQLTTAGEETDLGVTTGILFRGEAELLHVDVESAPDGLTLTLLWRPLAGARRTRFVDVCDARGRVIHSAPVNRAIARSAGHVLDRVRIPAHHLHQGTLIGTGFFEPGIGMARFDRGPGSQSAGRLNIVDLLNRKVLSLKGADPRFIDWPPDGDVK